MRGYVKQWIQTIIMDYELDTDRRATVLVGDIRCNINLINWIDE